MRVEETAYDPFEGKAPANDLDNWSLGPSPGKSLVLYKPGSTLVSRLFMTRMKHGVQLKGTDQVRIYDYVNIDFDGGGEIYGSAVKVGSSEMPTKAPTFIQRIVADGKEAPDASYKISNSDFIGIERKSGDVLVRDVTGSNYGDAGIDTKAGNTYVMNATLANTHRILRVWNGSTLTIANSIVNAAEGHSQIWLKDGSAKLKYYNVLWCTASEKPSRDDPKCSTTPTRIAIDDKTGYSQADSIEELKTNPLPAISPFFRTGVDRLNVEYSANGGPWTPLRLANTGENKIGPQGDLRYAIPLTLNNAKYRFRAYFEKAGLRVGAYSDIIGEEGPPIQ